MWEGGREGREGEGARGARMPAQKGKLHVSEFHFSKFAAHDSKSWQILRKSKHTQTHSAQKYPLTGR